MQRRLLIIGAGGHGKVVADTALATGRYEDIAFLDDDPSITSVLSFKVLGRATDFERYLSEFQDAVVAIGNNHTRYHFFELLLKLGFNLPAIIHPTAFVSRFAIVARGTVVFAHAVINADTEIKEACIINTASVIEHDCYIGKACHISPSATISGGVRIGDFSWIGSGANVKNNVVIGQNVIVGLGSAVISDVSSNKTVIGVPAKEK